MLTGTNRMMAEQAKAKARRAEFVEFDLPWIATGILTVGMFALVVVILTTGGN